MTYLQINFNELITENIIGLLGLIFSLMSLVIHFKNRQTNKKSFNLNIQSNKKNNVELVHISNVQNTNNHVSKLVVFNPNSQGVILQSLQVYKEHKSKYWLLRVLNLGKKWEIVDNKWWPTTKENDLEPKYLNDEYEQLYVSNSRIILVCMKGNRDKSLYRFHLKTSHQFINRITTIDGYDSNFPYNYYTY